MKRFLNILTWAFAIFWLAFATLSMVYVVAAGRSPTGPELFGYRFMMVQSDSMIPTIRAGDLVVGRPPAPETIREGQIVTYRYVPARRLITHRVVGVTQVGSELAFRTQGDGNNTPDESPVLARDVVAVFSFRLPYLGYLLAFARTWVGLVVLVVIPSVILMATEAARLVRLMRHDQHRAQPE
jgi:signal peptidase I